MIPAQDIDIRPLHREELDRLQESIPSQYHEGRLVRQERGESLFLVAWLSGRAAGQLVLTLAGSEEQQIIARAAGVPYISDIAVPEELRSQGIGTRLIRYAEGLVRIEGLKEVGLAVGTGNQRARMLYERLGYKDSKTGEFDLWWTYVDEDGRRHAASERCVYLRKRLDEGFGG